MARTLRPPKLPIPDRRTCSIQLEAALQKHPVALGVPLEYLRKAATWRLLKMGRAVGLTKPPIPSADANVQHVRELVLEDSLEHHTGASAILRNRINVW